jgi:hypothetical protein
MCVAGLSQVPVSADFTGTFASPSTSTVIAMHHTYHYFEFDVGSPDWTQVFAFGLQLNAGAGGGGGGGVGFVDGSARCPSRNASRDALPRLPDQFVLSLEVGGRLKGEVKWEDGKARDV